MRFDETGLFWDDWKPPKIKKEKVVRVPPDPVWLRDDYLPYLDEALAFDPPVFTDDELIQAFRNKERLVYDTESYPNYWSIGFLSIDSGKCIYFESTDEEPYFDKYKLRWIMENFLLIDFNGEKYDRHVINIALLPNSVHLDMWEATDSIINWQTPGWMVARNYRAKKLQINHIDLYELTALAPSLKTMAGRLGSPLMMDLPFPPGTHLSYEQRKIVFWYMFNDLRNTWLLYNAHFENIKLREAIGPRYGLDLRSKSDAQMAEAIFRKEAFNRTGRSPEPPPVRAGYSFKLRMPEWIQFITPDLQWVYDQVKNADFIIGESGYIQMPAILADMLIPIGDGRYQMGIGGLHSTEKSIYHVDNEEWALKDFDVPSYYPKLILGSGMYPPAIGPSFIPIYRGIVEERLEAKHAGHKVKSEGLKIVVNGTFGKTLDPYSIMYYPELGIQTTVPGQLALLMLIERINLTGFIVASANTDGIMIKYRKDQANLLDLVIKKWEHDTGLELEGTDYVAIFSRDVNNYLAFKPDGKIKAKGFYGEMGLKKNPQMEICSDAIANFLMKGIPIEKTIRECQDINKFVSVRNVRGGCCKVYPDHTEYIGKVARWIYTYGESGEIVTTNKGHIVPTTENAKPIMRYTGQFPIDLKYEYYEEVARENLRALGYNQ